MDEITIGEQKYVSSKRAALITGYAKDYVGQMCREGRIEARLVGRNWYVREAALRDHRFGVENAPSVAVHPEPVIEKPSAPLWEAKYQPVEQNEPVLHEGSIDQPQQGQIQIVDTATEMQTAWQNWFSQTKSGEMSESVLPLVKEEDADNSEKSISESGVSVQFTRIDEIKKPANKEEIISTVRHGGSYRAVKIGMALIAIFVALFTSISIGILNIENNITETAAIIDFIKGIHLYSK
jgi:hypothetical protein